MSNYIEFYSIILKNFQTNDLQSLLAVYDRYQSNNRSVLINRAVEILKTTSSTQFLQSYLSKINEIFISMPNYYLVMKVIQSIQNQIPAPRQIMHRPPPPPYPGQTVNIITQAGFPKASPQIHRNYTVANTIQGSSTANNNIQYFSGNYQMAGPSTVASRFPLGQRMNVPSTTINPNLPAVFNNVIPAHETVSKIKFKKLTFYDIMGEIIKPSVLYSTNKTAVRSSWTFRLNLSVKHINIISLNQDLSNEENYFPYQYQIRICQVNSDCTEVTDYLPRGIQIIVNDNFNELPPKIITKSNNPKVEDLRIPKPIDITMNIKLSPFLKNNITISWYTDENHYAMGIYVVKILTADNLIQRLKEKETRSSEETRKYITEKLIDNDPDLATTHYPFSLVCPLGKIRMKIPAKSIHCEHLQCFDARIFISMNEKKPTWKCPTCNKPCLYDDIQIQNYFMEVITSPSLEDCTTKIQILPDGTWEACDENKYAKTATSTANIVKNLVSNNEESARTQGFVDLTSNTN